MPNWKLLSRFLGGSGRVRIHFASRGWLLSSKAQGSLIAVNIRLVLGILLLMFSARQTLHMAVASKELEASCSRKRPSNQPCVHGTTPEAACLRAPFHTAELSFLFLWGQAILGSQTDQRPFLISLSAPPNFPPTLYSVAALRLMSPLRLGLSSSSPPPPLPPPPFPLSSSSTPLKK